jgi:flagellar hook assembly protein FlgD
VLRLRLGRGAVGSIRIFNLRGELVRELVAGRFEAGDNEFVWRGLDDRGNSVASGVYLVEYEVDGLREHQKVALVR